MDTRNPFWTLAGITVRLPFVFAGLLHDEIRWRKISTRVPSEPGMSAWFATTIEDVARFWNGKSPH